MATDSKILDYAPDNKRLLDTEEIARTLKNIPEADREKLYFMMKGIELMNDCPNRTG